nr:arginine--tRNA ligase, chloroplastic/mitochondrial-like isoform X2 [Tanacetum cinerariifolium]
MAAARPEENIGSLKEQIARVFEELLRITIPYEAEVVPIIAPCTRKEAGDYQCNNAMSLWSKIKGKEAITFTGPQLVRREIMDNLPPTDMIESYSIAGLGFINVILSRQWIAQSIQRMLTYGIHTWAPKLPVKRAIVDFFLHPIAKEMHLGTQLGMLIEFLFERFPDRKVNDQDIGELEAIYKASKQRFDGDAEFKTRAQQAMVSL